MYLYMVAPCLFGLEGLVSDDLKCLGAENVSAENGRVFFEGNENILARANICCRFAERILIVMDRFEARSFTELFDSVKLINWSDFIGAHDAFPVKGHCVSSALHSVPDCQRIIKKAVADSLSEDYGVNWLEESGSVHQIQFSIIKDEAVIMLDTSGAGLHKRGYRPQANDAPIRETLAAAMCSLSKLRHYHTMYDPFCGSGTLLVEGAMLANHIAPGANRDFTARKWGLFDERIWREERERAESLVKKDTDFIAFGSDISHSAVELSARNAKNAGVEKFIRLEVKDIKNFAPSSEKGTLITNPPYGERMLDISAAEKLYKMMGGRFERRKGWSYGIISPDEEFEKCFGRKADKRRKLYNGMIKCQYYMYFKSF